MTELTAIVNPKAGRGSGREAAHAFQRACSREGINVHMIFTNGPGEATTIARDATTRIVAVVGGDGTINEVANGLYGSQKTLAVVPAGSGNDFAKAIGLARGLDGAVDAIKRRTVHAVDVGEIHIDVRNTPGSPIERRFVNGAGIGFDGEVAARMQGSRMFTGTLSYVASVLTTLWSYSSPEFCLTVDGDQCTGRFLLIAIGNGACAGGGFYLTPEARPDDSLLDLCVIDRKSIFGIIRLMPLVMKGKHGDVVGTRFLKGKEIGVTAQTGFAVHADGEIVGQHVRSIRIGLAQRRLPVLVGENWGWSR